MQRAILARHGESAYSVRGLLNGDPSVPVGLTPAGVEQARGLGEQLRDAEIDVVVTSALPRAIETADVAVDGRDVPRVVVAELNDPRYGSFEGRELEEYRAWAASSASSAAPEGGGESRRAIVARYARAYRTVLTRPEQTLLVVCHSLPISYALLARTGDEPAARVPLVAYATPLPFTVAELETVVDGLDRWLAAPTW